jgi:hypothetical protein
MIQAQKLSEDPGLSENTIDQDWLEGDLSNLDEYEPYNWGELDPLTLGKPIKYVSDRGFVVEGGKENV